MKSVAWICVDFGAGSGGHRTVFQNFNYLAKHGYKCDLYVIDAKEPEEELKARIAKDYFDLNGGIYTGKTLRKKYDMIIATYYETVECVVKMEAEKKVYFIQDYEPWFFPMSENYLMARKSYQYGLNGISIGKWLAKKIQESFKMKMSYFDFGADLQTYCKLDNSEKEDAICFIYQPDKPRRCVDMGLRALQIVQSVRPETKIYLYGSQKMIPFNIRAEHLGVITVEECNRLYNKCRVGLCLSASNPSRVPFEMMAAGLPVVDMYLENNLYDFPEQGCLLAEPSAEAIAGAILKLLNNEKMQRKMSVDGAKYMMDFPLEKGFEEFKKAIDDCFERKCIKREQLKKIYKGQPITWTGSKFKIKQKVYFKSEEEIEAERLELEREEARKKEEEWRNNLTVPQKVFLKIRYILKGY